MKIRDIVRPLLQEIYQSDGLVEKYPNDQQLGRAVRDFIRQLQSHRRKREENNS